MKTLKTTIGERPEVTRYSGSTPQPSRSKTSDFASSSSSGETVGYEVSQKISDNPKSKSWIR